MNVSLSKEGCGPLPGQNQHDRETARWGPAAGRISNDIVGFYREHFGRGPTESKTYVEPDLVVCLMGDVATPQEQSLIEVGRAEVARDARAAVRRHRSRDLATIVERELGRRVKCILGEFDPEENMVALVFPLEAEQPDREEMTGAGSFPGRQSGLHGYSVGDDAQVLALEGDIDEAVADELEQRIRRAPQAGRPIVIADVLGSDHLSEWAIRAMVRAHTLLENAGGRLLIVCARPENRKRLRDTSAGVQLELMPNVGEALARAVQP